MANENVRGKYELNGPSQQPAKQVSLISPWHGRGNWGQEVRGLPQDHEGACFGEPGLKPGQAGFL